MNPNYSNEILCLRDDSLERSPTNAPFLRTYMSLKKDEDRQVFIKIYQRLSWLTFGNIKKLTKKEQKNIFEDVIALNGFLFPVMGIKIPEKNIKKVKQFLLQQMFATRSTLPKQEDKGYVSVYMEI